MSRHLSVRTLCTALVLALSSLPLSARQNSVAAVPDSPASPPFDIPAPTLQNLQRISSKDLWVVFAVEPLQSYVGNLILQPAVQRDIALSDYQTVQVDVLLRMIQEHRPIVIQTGQANLLLSLSVGTQRTEEEKEEKKAASEAADEAFALLCTQQGEQEQAQRQKIQLKPAQKQRLRQLDLQLRGVLSLADPLIAKEAGLSGDERTSVEKQVDELYQQIKALNEETHKYRTDLIHRYLSNNPTPEDQAFVAARQQAQTERSLQQARRLCLAAEYRVITSLSPKQRIQWRLMTGSPLKSE